MSRNRVFGLASLVAAAALVAPLSGIAQSAGGVPVKVTVTAVGHKGADPASVAKEDVQVRQKDQRRPVISWVSAGEQNVGLDLIILVDDALDDVADLLAHAFLVERSELFGIQRGEELRVELGFNVKPAVGAGGVTECCAKAGAHGSIQSTSARKSAGTAR